MRILANGMFGKDVSILQHTLNQRGENLSIDGWFGMKTEAAVKRFQKRNSLFVDGIAGYQTASFLGFVEKSTPEYVLIHSSASPEMIAGCDAKRICSFPCQIATLGKTRL